MDEYSDGHKYVNKLLGSNYEKDHHDWKNLCDELDYKYLISIDGWVSAWFRGPNILQSNSVPLIIESAFTPLFFDQWVPYVHYVPVKKNLTNLVS
jgi:hypothetical protein